jgi:type II secretory pathway pseudopilin PulG
MQISNHGKIEQEAGFIMLRDLLVLLVIIICAAIVLNALMIFVHQGALFMQNAEQSINERNSNLERLTK